MRNPAIAPRAVPGRSQLIAVLPPFFRPPNATKMAPEEAVGYYRVGHFIKAPTLLRLLLPADPLLGTPSSLLGTPSWGGSSLTRPLPSWRWAARRLRPPSGAAGQLGLLLETPPPARPPGAGRPQLARGSVAEDPPAAPPPERGKEPGPHPPSSLAGELQGLTAALTHDFLNRPPTCLPWARLR
jgi:hypothetical protein